MTDGVRRLQPHAAHEAVELLCESFFDYPVMRYVLGDVPGYEDRLVSLIGFFVAARVHREEPILGLGVPGALRGVALVSFPQRASGTHALAALREEVWAGLGEDARRRYETFARACAPFGIDAPHVHVNMIGVRRAAQGVGVGRTLLGAVHALSAADPESVGVSLTTESPANVPLYEHLGYELLGRAEVDSTLSTWGFFRPDTAGAISA